MEAPKGYREIIERAEAAGWLVETLWRGEEQLELHVEGKAFRDEYCATFIYVKGETGRWRFHASSIREKPSGLSEEKWRAYRSNDVRDGRWTGQLYRQGLLDLLEEPALIRQYLE